MFSRKVKETLLGVLVGDIQLSVHIPRLQNHPGRVVGKPPNYSLKDSNINLVSSAQSDTVKVQCKMYWISFEKVFCKKKEHWGCLCQQDRLIIVGSM